MSILAFAWKILRLLPPECAHRAAIHALRHNLLPARKLPEFPALRVKVCGREFANPVGIAAGFDKNAEAVDGLFRMGFGFVEAGTVTPRPQPGNPRPRIFRLEEDEAVINRLGFNGAGMEVFAANVARRKQAGTLGINMGKNKDTADPVADYVVLLNRLYAFADYITVNISSPNTPGLRALQEKETLAALAAALVEERTRLAALHGKTAPLFFKIAPDLSDAECEDIAATALEKGIDGLIVSNTTISRPESLQSSHKAETGGLSGKPVFALSTEKLRRIYALTQGRLPLIGVGGIASAEDAYTKIRAGASLVQLYTALTYQGFGLAARIVEGLAALLARDGFTHISEAVGAEQRR